MHLTVILSEQQKLKDTNNYSDSNVEYATGIYPGLASAESNDKILGTFSGRKLSFPHYSRDTPGNLYGRPQSRLSSILNET